MTNYTFEQRKMIAEYLEEMIKDEEVCLFDREDDGERFSLGDCVNAIPSDDILRVIKQLKTVTFGDIKNQVGTKFKVPALHKNRIFMVCNFVSDPNKKVILNTASKAIIENVTDFFKDEHLVEVINETEAN